jgi:hypothetical protein
VIELATPGAVALDRRTLVGEAFAIQGAIDRDRRCVA